jgi:hypothetical protein
MVSGLSEKLSLRANSLSEQAKNTSNEDIKDANRKFYEFFVKHMGNYYKSVQNLLEGRR